MWHQDHRSSQVALMCVSRAMDVFLQLYYQLRLVWTWAYIQMNSNNQCWNQVTLKTSSRQWMILQMMTMTAISSLVLKYIALINKKEAVVLTQPCIEVLPVSLVHMLQEEMKTCRVLMTNRQLSMGSWLIQKLPVFFLNVTTFQHNKKVMITCSSLRNILYTQCMHADFWLLHDVVVHVSNN